MNIKNKIIVNVILISILSIVVTTSCIIWQSNKTGKEVLFSIAKDRLTNVRYFKTLQVENYFQNLIDDLFSLSINQKSVEALQHFSKAFPKYIAQAKSFNMGYNTQVVNDYINDYVEKYRYYNVGKDIDINKIINLTSENSFALQYSYIFNNKNNLSNKDDLNDLNNGTDYSMFHARYHQSFVAFKKKFGFYDIFLVNAKTGDVVYTVNKEIDFATSLISGPYVNSGLGEVFNKVVNSNKENFIAVADFAPYLANYDNQSAFFGTSILDSFGNKIGVVIIQLAIDQLNDIMTNGDQWRKIGLGETVNSVIVGPDYKLRTSNRFFLENPAHFLEELKKSGVSENEIALMKAKNSIIGILKTDTLAVRQAFSGIEGFTDYVDYRNIPVLGSFASLKINGLNWVIVVKINKEEALSWVQILNKKVIFNSIPLTIIVAMVAIIFGAAITNGIMIYVYKITKEINNIAESKDLTKRLKIAENNEFTIMINAFNNFIDALHNMLKNIVDSSAKANYKMKVKYSKLKENNNEQGKDDFVKEDLFDLSKQISDLSKEFKIIENENERTKYW
jgi:methyl-accepting chemotaxis protein